MGITDMLGLRDQIASITTDGFKIMSYELTTSWDGTRMTLQYHVPTF